MTTQFYLTDDDAEIYNDNGYPYKTMLLGRKVDYPSHVRAQTKSQDFFGSPWIPITRVATDPATKALAWISEPLIASDLLLSPWQIHVWCNQDTQHHASLRARLSRWQANGTITTLFDTLADMVTHPTILPVRSADCSLSQAIEGHVALQDRDRLIFELALQDASTSPMTPGGIVTVSYNGLYATTEGDSSISSPDDLLLIGDIPEKTRERVRSVIQDYDPTESLLRADDLDLAIQRALAEYSVDRPRVLSSTLSGDGVTYDFPLPRMWNQNVSRIIAIEYPILTSGFNVQTPSPGLGGQIPFLLNQDDWEIYQRSSGSQPVRTIRFRELTIEAGTDNAIIRYTAGHIHTTETDTIPQGDLAALAQLMAAHAALMMSARAAKTSDSTLSSDSVNYRDAQVRWISVAKELRMRYQQHIGEGGENPGMGITRQWHTNLSWGQDRIFHRRRIR